MAVAVAAGLVTLSAMYVGPRLRGPAQPGSDPVGAHAATSETTHAAVDGEAPETAREIARARRGSQELDALVGLGPERRRRGLDAWLRQHPAHTERARAEALLAATRREVPAAVLAHAAPARGWFLGVDRALTLEENEERATRVRLWALSPTRELRAWSPSWRVTAVLAEPDGAGFYLGGDHPELWRVDATTGDVTRRLPNPWGEVLSLALSPDRTRLAIGSRDSVVHVIALAGGRTVGTRGVHLNWAHDLGFAGDLLVTISRPGADRPHPLDSQLRAWELSAGTMTLSAPQVQRCERVACSPDGRTAVLGLGDGRLVVFDVLVGAELGELVDPAREDGLAHAGRITGLGFTPDGRLVSVGGGPFGREDRSLLVWDVARRTLLDARRALPAAPRSLDVSPDGSRVLLGVEGGVELWVLDP